VLRQVAISCLLAALALPAAARTRPHYGGTLRVEIEGDPWQRTGGLARRMVLDGLTTIGPDGTVLPALAVRWTSENNDHRWQFWLRSGVHFQNDTALSSAAVEASLTASCGASCPWSAMRAAGSSVVLTADSPMPNLPALLAGDKYLIGFDADPHVGIVGTGPFAATGELNNPGVTRLVANETCWQGRPFLDSVEISSRKSIHDQWLDLSVGRADLVEVPAEQMRQAHDQRLAVVASPLVSLLALTVSDSGALSSPSLRAAIALAVDRGALSNVIFQKQGEIAASLLPAELTGYAFLFSTQRDLNKAHELRGGVAPPALTLAAEGGAAMQLAAQRIALNLRDAGFSVQVVSAGAPQHIDLTLRRLTLESSQPQCALESILRAASLPVPVTEQTPAGLYKVERAIVDTHLLIPLLYLPRAYAVGGRVRDLRLGPDGAPQLAGVALEDAP
jgi:MarR-like DNA-binding transcriptional regulator SgrR of sgrS sRNA